MSNIDKTLQPREPKKGEPKVPALRRAIARREGIVKAVQKKVANLMKEVSMRRDYIAYLKEKIKRDKEIIKNLKDREG